MLDTIFTEQSFVEAVQAAQTIADMIKLTESFYSAATDTDWPWHAVEIHSRRWWESGFAKRAKPVWIEAKQER